MCLFRHELFLHYYDGHAMVEERWSEKGAGGRREKRVGGQVRKPAVTDTSVVSKLLRESLQTIYLLFSKTAKWDLNSDLT